VSNLRIHPVEPGEYAAWAALAGGTTWPRSRPVPPPGERPSEPWTWLGAWRDDRCIGRLRAAHPQASMALVEEVVVAAEEDGEGVATALVGALGPHLPLTCLLYAEEVEEDRPLRRWIEGAGYEVARRKVVVACRLPRGEILDRGGLSLHSLAEVGKAAFAATLEAASEGDPFEPEGAHDALRELGDLIAYAGDAFDPSAWWIVREGEEDVGAVLPQTEADEPEAGSIFYVGIVPEKRGRGFGRLLHALALDALAARGAKRYVGSTELRNAPMRRVFARNGCREIARQVFYAPPKRG